MSQTRRNDGQATYDKNRRNSVQRGRNRDVYQYGSAAPAVIPYPETRRAPRRAPMRPTQEERQEQTVVREKRVHRMSIGYVFFLVVMTGFSAWILANYVQLQSTYTTICKQVTRQERELSALKSANNDEYNRVQNSVDFEKIKQIAIGELGMDYATEGQIIYYSNESKDYMRQTK